MVIYLLLNFISLYLCSCMVIYKAGYKLYYGLIPLVNIYYMCKILNIHPLILIILGLLLIFIPYKNLIATIMYIFIPFLIVDAFVYSNISMFYGILALVLPFVAFPIIAMKGDYQYAIY